MTDSTYINERLDRLFGNLRPQLPDEEPEEMGLTERTLLGLGQDTYDEVFRKQEKEAQTAAELTDAQAITDALELAHQATGMSYDRLRDRLANPVDPSFTDVAYPDNVDGERGGQTAEQRSRAEQWQAAETTAWRNATGQNEAER